MDFELSDTHRAIQTTAREFAQLEVAPRAGEWDAREQFPAAVIPKLGKLGFLGIQIDPAYGGSARGRAAVERGLQEALHGDGIASAAERD